MDCMNKNFLFPKPHGSSRCFSGLFCGYENCSTVISEKKRGGIRSRIILVPSHNNFRDPGSHPRLLTRVPLRLSDPSRNMPPACCSSPQYFHCVRSAVSCLPLLEPILAPSDVARSARVVAFSSTSRFEPVGTLNPAHRAEYRALPPSAPAARFHSDFFGGGIQKRNGRQEAGAAEICSNASGLLRCHCIILYLHPQTTRSSALDI